MCRLWPQSECAVHNPLCVQSALLCNQGKSPWTRTKPQSNPEGHGLRLTEWFQALAVDVGLFVWVFPLEAWFSCVKGVLHVKGWVGERWELRQWIQLLCSGQNSFWYRGIYVWVYPSWIRVFQLFWQPWNKPLGDLSHFSSLYSFVLLVFVAVLGFFQTFFTEGCCELWVGF